MSVVEIREHAESQDSPCSAIVLFMSDGSGWPWQYLCSGSLKYRLWLMDLEVRRHYRSHSAKVELASSASIISESEASLPMSA